MYEAPLPAETPSHSPQRKIAEILFLGLVCAAVSFTVTPVLGAGKHFLPLILSMEPGPVLVGCAVFPADNGSAWYISGAPDERWNNDHLHALHQIPGSAFEAVDSSSLIQSPHSGQIRTNVN